MQYYRRNLLVLWVSTFLTSVSWTQIVPFLPLFLEELGVVDNLSVWSGVVYSLQSAAGILMAPIWGRIADRRGRKLMAVRAGFCLAAIYLLTGFATQPWHVALLRFLNGALTGFIPSSIALLATNTPRHLAPAYVASLQVSTASGTIIGPVIGGILAGFFGYRGSFFVSGSAVLFATFLVLILAEERHREPSGERTTLRQDFRTAFHSPDLLSVMITTFLATFAGMGVQPIITLYMQDLLSEGARSASSVIFALPGIAVFLTARAWVSAGKRAGYGSVIRKAILASAATGILLPLFPSIYWFGVLFFIQGIFLAGLRPLSSAIISDEVDPAYGGRAFGMQQSATTFGGMIGPLVTGAASAALGNPSAFWVIAGVLFIGAAVLSRMEQASPGTPAHHSRRVLW